MAAAQRVVIPGFVPSEWDRGEQRNFAFPGQQITTNMIRRNINIPYFESARRFMPGVLYFYSRGKCTMEGRAIGDNALTIATSEMIASNLPDGCFATRALARKNFIRGGLQSLVSLGYENAYSEGLNNERPSSQHHGLNNILLRIPMVVPNDVDQFVHTLLGNREDPNQELPALQDNDYSADLAQAVALLLDLLASHSTARGRALECNLYTLMYVSLAKRGTITQAKINAINNAVSAETNFQCDIASEDVKTCANSLNRYIDETNAVAVMDGLRQNKTGFSLQLALTVQQTAKSRMTAYWSIDAALRLFSDFNWAEASRFIGDDFIRYQAARTVVAGNQYYGFRADLGDAKHTLYKSLSWLAIKLLINFKGSEYGSLNNYRGLPAHPDREQDLQALIDAYQPAANPAHWDGVDAFLEAVRH